MPGLSDAEIEALEAKSAPPPAAPAGMSDQEIEALEAKQSPPEDAPGAATLSLMNRAGRGILDAVGTASKYVDAYSPIGAPLRAAVGAGQHLDGETAWEAYKRQYGEDPAKAPTAKQLAEKAGLSTDENIPQPLIINPWAKEQPKLSAAGLVGGLVETTLDPLSYVPFEKIPGALLKGATEIPAAMGRAVAPKVGRVVAGIPEKKTLEYIANPERIGQMAGVSAEELENKASRGVAQTMADRDASRKLVEDSKSKLDDAYKSKRLELEGKTASLSEAQEIMAALDQEKTHLGSLSTQADDALVRSGATFQRDHLLELIDQAGASLGEDIVGKQAKEAAANLKGFRDAVVSMPDEIDATRLRNIMRQLRQDMDFDLKAGQFNSASNRILQEVTGGMSRALKDASPEYAAYMERMSSLAGVTEDMSAHFGSETSAIGSLDALKRPGGAKSQVVEDAVNRYATATGNKELPTKIADIKSNRELLARMKSGDLRSELHPDLYKELAERQAENEMAERAATDVDRLSENRMQSIVKKQGGENPSHLDRIQLENLQQQTGENLSQQIADKGTLDAFGKDHTRGSRLTILGGGIGTYIGSKVGAPAAGAMMGGAVGAAGDKFAGQFFKGTLDAGMAAKSKADTVVKALLDAPEKLGKYQNALKQSINKGPKAFLLDHHVLMHNDAGYRDMVGGLSQPAEPPEQKTSASVDPMSKIQAKLKNPESLGQYAEPLMNAAQRGNQALAVTHFMLSQTDPDYAQTVNGK